MLCVGHMLCVGDRPGAHGVVGAALAACTTFRPQRALVLRLIVYTLTLPYHPDQPKSAMIHVELVYIFNT